MDRYLEKYLEMLRIPIQNKNLTEILGKKIMPISKRNPNHHFFRYELSVRGCLWRLQKAKNHVALSTLDHLDLSSGFTFHLSILVV